MVLSSSSNLLELVPREEASEALELLGLESPTHPTRSSARKRQVAAAALQHLELNRRWPPRRVFDGVGLLTPLLLTNMVSSPSHDARGAVSSARLRAAAMRAGASSLPTVRRTAALSGSCSELEPRADAL